MARIGLILSPYRMQDAAHLMQFMEKDCANQLMVGINPEFDIVRVQILGKEEVSSLNDIYLLLLQKKARVCHARILLR